MYIGELSPPEFRGANCYWGFLLLGGICFFEKKMFWNGYSNQIRPAFSKDYGNTVMLVCNVHMIGIRTSDFTTVLHPGSWQLCGRKDYEPLR